MCGIALRTTTYSCRQQQSTVSLRWLNWYIFIAVFAWYFVRTKYVQRTLIISIPYINIIVVVSDLLTARQQQLPAAASTTTTAEQQNSSSSSGNNNVKNNDNNDNNNDQNNYNTAKGSKQSLWQQVTRGIITATSVSSSSRGRISLLGFLVSKMFIHSDDESNTQLATKSFSPFPRPQKLATNEYPVHCISEPFTFCITYERRNKI